MHALPVAGHLPGNVGAAGTLAAVVLLGGGFFGKFLGTFPVFFGTGGSLAFAVTASPGGSLVVGTAASGLAFAGADCLGSNGGSPGLFLGSGVSLVATAGGSLSIRTSWMGSRSSLFWESPTSVLHVSCREKPTIQQTLGWHYTQAAILAKAAFRRLGVMASWRARNSSACRQVCWKSPGCKIAVMGVPLSSHLVAADLGESVSPGCCCQILMI